MADTSGRHLLVTFLVTREGEQGHPMNTIVRRVDLADDGTPTPAALDRLVESIANEVVRKAATGYPVTDNDWPVCVCPDCIRCGCNLAWRHHTAPTECVPAVAR